MKNKKILFAIFLLCGLFAAGVVPQTVLAQGVSPGPFRPIQPVPVYQQNNMSIDIRNSSFRIISDTLPIFSFWDVNNLDEKYIVRITDLIEFNDTNGDGIPQPTEKALGGHLALASGEWDVSDVINETLNDTLQAIHFNYTMVNITVPKYENLSLQFRFHLFVENTTVNTDGIETFVIGNRELKFDIVIENWDWVEEGDQLAIRMILTSTHGRTLRHRQMIQNRALAWENEGNASGAYFRYESQISTRTNTNVALMNITSGVESTNGTSPILYLVYPYFNDSQMIHDPTLGLMVGGDATGTTLPSINEFITSPIFIFGLTGIVLVASFMVLRKRK
ncbi:MAG: hypothetical protein ACTSUV_03290 [Candidatus Ranarchaeia archaeon]